MDGGDFRVGLAAVQGRRTTASSGNARTAAAGTYVSRARLGADGALAGTEELRGGPAPPPGFVPPAVTFTFVRAPSP